jgi:hypothetical protein
MESKEKKDRRGSDELKERWRQHITAWRTSRSTQVAFCREHDLSRHAFQYWKKRFERESLSHGFVELVAPAKRTGEAIEIFVDERFRIRVSEQVSSDHLRMVLRTVLEL